MYSLLLSSAGRRVELLRCFREAARQLGIPLRVAAADAAPGMSAACQEADQAFELPRCADADFVPALLHLCSQQKIDLLVPTIDPELELLAEEQARFRQNGTAVCISHPDVVRIARNKLLTHSFLTELGIPSPRTADLKTVLNAAESWSLPAVVKPVSGSSSVDIHLAHSVAELEHFASSRSDYLVQEHWEGAEYTVNLFFDRERLRCAIPHRRCEVRAGEVSKGVTERVPLLMEISECLGTALAGRAFGPLCFQAIVTPEGRAAVIELNARFGGGYPLAHRAGAHFVKWLLELGTSAGCSARNNWRENVLMLRYDAAIFTGPGPRQNAD